MSNAFTEEVQEVEILAEEETEFSDGETSGEESFRNYMNKA